MSLLRHIADQGSRRFGSAARLFAAVCLLLLTSFCATGAEPKRVLVIHSFGTVAPPFTTHSTAFEAELVKQMGNHVDLDEVSLDMARYAAPDMQEAVVDYLEKRSAKWKPDLVVPIGGPAGIFVAKFRQRLFPDIPVLYCSLDQRLLGPEAFDKNTAFVGADYQVRGFAEDILQIAPDTKNIAIVIGATPLEQYWAEAFRNGFQPFTDRVNFIWLNDLPFDQMLERVQTLPPHSFIFLILFLRDAAGVTQNADEALQRLHAVANAPINSIFTSQMGLGIVGGRLYPSTEDGMKAADTAVRILNGARPSSFPPRIVPPSPPQYDGRELRRWKIDKRHLPAGSTILFQTPTVWQQYRWWIIAGVSVCVVQAVLIAGLVANLIRRRRLEGSLVESEGRFQMMADAAPVLIWMAGPDKRCTFFNQAWLDFTGRTMKQECGNGWSEGVHPDDLEKCTKQYITSFDARQSFLMQYRLRRKDGEYRWVTDSGVPRYDAAGSFLGYIGACVDVTELEEKENALRAFEQRVTLAAEAAHLGVWELDIETKDIWMSDAARKLFQFDPEEQVSYQSLIDRVHPEDRPKREAALQRAIETEGGYDMEFRTVLPNGTIRWISGRARCMSRGTSKSSRLVGVSMDVTERKQAEQLFQLATEASPSGILLVNDQENIVLVNAHIENLFGYRRDELSGKPITVLLPEGFKNDDKGVCSGDGSVARALGTSRELFGRRRDGSEFPVEIGLSSIETPQGVLVLVTMVDISLRKAAEEEVRRRREQIELLSRISLLGEMTASIAHELNQPLSAIISNASAGQRFIDRGSAELATLREILVDVAADARRAHDVMQNIRNTIKKGAAVRQRIDLNQVVTSVTHLIQATATAHECEVRISLAKNLPEVEGDPIQIQQVLVNLVNNAFEAMNGIAPPNRKVEIATQNGQDSVSVSIRDHGVGISNDARTRLFDQFFTTKEDGLGMGLAIVRSIIETHGGRIAAENAEDGGARFYFTMPAAKPVPK
jgi:PAS domain S-box-containing protein